MLIYCFIHMSELRVSFERLTNSSEGFSELNSHLENIHEKTIAIQGIITDSNR